MCHCTTRKRQWPVGLGASFSLRVREVPGSKPRQAWVFSFFHKSLSRFSPNNQRLNIYKMTIKSPRTNNMQPKNLPCTGLEPLTLRFKVWSSTYWANRQLFWKVDRNFIHVDDINFPIVAVNIFEKVISATAHAPLGQVSKWSRKFTSSDWNENGRKWKVLTAAYQICCFIWISMTFLFKRNNVCNRKYRNQPEFK